MDRLEEYRNWIQEVLRDYGNIKPANGEIQVFTCFDVDQDHYQVFHAGWNQYKRIFGVLIHIDIIDEKVWIQHDGTELGIANVLVEKGIPKTDIVLGYHAPVMRQYDTFAVG
ncbi:MAG: XisI protein [Prochlorotrichaceae cyanobacterium]